MARYGMQIYQVHIVDGFVDDCDELLHRCRQVNILTYDMFTEIWKGMGFAYLYRNRASHVEVAEMSEEFIHVAKRYMVANTSNYEDSVMGLFLVYALVNLQPYPGFAPLRLTPDDVPAITRIEAVARRERRFDVLRVLGSVLIEGPCVYSVVNRARGMETGFRKYFEGYTSMNSEGIRPNGVFYRQNTELDLIREIIVLDKRYSDAKTCVTANNKPDACLSYTDSKLPLIMESSLKKVINGVFAAEQRVQSQTESTRESDESEDRYDVVQRIKMKAMKGTVDTMNHLHGIQERKKQKPTATKKSREINTKGGNVKSSSPKKPIKSGSPKKRKATKTVSSKKKKIKIKSEDDTDDSCESLDLSSDIDPITDEEEDFLLPKSLKLDDTDKINTNDNIHENSEKANEMRSLESLPILVNTGDNEYIEIEVIDEVNPSNNTTKSNDENIVTISKPEITATDTSISTDDENIEYIQIEIIDSKSPSDNSTENNDDDNVIANSKIAGLNNFVNSGDNNEYLEITAIDEVSSDTKTKSNIAKTLKIVPNPQNTAPVSVEKQTDLSELRNEDILKRINELPHLSIERVPAKDTVIRRKANSILNCFKSDDDDIFKKPKAVKSKKSICKPLKSKKEQPKSKSKLKK